jgi:hypothetical protein
MNVLDAFSQVNLVFLSSSLLDIRQLTPAFEKALMYQSTEINHFGEREDGFAALRTCLEIRRRAMRTLSSLCSGGGGDHPLYIIHKAGKAEYRSFQQSEVAKLLPLVSSLP